ncbi:hypothetical protein EAI_01094 [Harpegnathos saltator]|uniref:Uncharacterized protein n=1 Tax=Harpegnathos saltator TaxID=610380 RepID=E2C8Z3_HARSA|nr:hypothetical protein EAI_01094 [Harpegnathos saltator]
MNGIRCHADYSPGLSRACGTSSGTPPGNTPQWSDDSSGDRTPECPRYGPIRVTLTKPHLAY